MSYQFRKSDSSPDQVRTIDRIEVLADKTFKNLALFRRPWHFTAWAALTESIRVVETSVPPDLYASRNHINAATNMSMMAALIYRFARRYGTEGLLVASSESCGHGRKAHSGLQERNYGPSYRAAKYPELQGADALLRRRSQHSVERYCNLHRFTWVLRRL